MRTILYICTGNTCRSPMAEAIARHQVEQGVLLAGMDVFIASAGTSTFPDMPTTPEAMRALADRGIAHSGRSKPLTAEMIRKADLVFCMTAGHLETARALVAGQPDEEQKIRLLDPAGDVPDPIGHGQDAYDALAGRLMELIPARMKEAQVT